MRAFTPFAVVFTGKERDAETGYDNHDARYRWTVSGDWMSVDPLADKFIGTSLTKRKILLPKIRDCYRK